MTQLAITHKYRGLISIVHFNPDPCFDTDSSMDIPVVFLVDLSLGITILQQTDGPQSASPTGRILSFVLSKLVTWQVVQPMVARRLENAMPGTTWSFSISRYT